MLGKVIRQRREKIGLSLRAAARQLDINPAYLSRVEAGKVPPSEQLLCGLAELLGLNGDELVLLSGRLPKSIHALVEREPYQATIALRTMAEMIVSEPGTPYGRPLLSREGTRAIEDGFPFEELSEIAEVESWRKEVYRPIYHIHKWWAQRLGSVFRAAILGATAPRGSSIMDLFYEPVRLPGVVVFDPFMGSGTTVGEAQKLGCTVIGRDINPVAFRTVQVALGEIDRNQLIEHYRTLESSIGNDIRDLYLSTDSSGKQCDVLYYFWVKYLTCPACGEQVDLFSRYVFAKHTYAKQNPGAQIVCPECGDVFSGRYDSSSITCRICGNKFNPQEGPARRATALCRSCSHSFAIAETAKSVGTPPNHRLYAKLVLRKDGTKEYLRTTKEDIRMFEASRAKLELLDPPLPRVPIRNGFNTRQILNYGYQSWHELFNARQLLALSMLANAIRDLPKGSARDALSILFSGVLEFNNMFASFKGEGTGAVRHMFSHHILKPERTPIEANLWGTPKSSGAFSTLFKSRLLRALEYRQAPFEIAVEHKSNGKAGRKVFGISPPLGGPMLKRCPKGGVPPGATYISCGDSSETDLPSNSVDLVVTDPPFFDNVHYSELADFFYVWQQLYFSNKSRTTVWTTRSDSEVQDTEAGAFSDKLQRVFKECCRVLRDEGILVFSYHHSREDGWSSVAQAVIRAGFSIVQSQPVKSEMSVAAPKSQAKEPIDIDVFLVCRKRRADHRSKISRAKAFADAIIKTQGKMVRFNRVGRLLSRNDVQVVLLSQLLVDLCPGRNAHEVREDLDLLLIKTRDSVERVWKEQDIQRTSEPIGLQTGPLQMDFLSPVRSKAKT